MITQIEIDGFKTFKDFKVELAPFQVIVGPNGSGKSNLFDALHLLSRLAEKDIYTAFQELRGDAGELFMKYPDGKRSERIWIAVEMLLDRKGRDAFGKEVELEYRRLRYELEIIQHTNENELGQLDIAHESLRVIPVETDSWLQEYNAPRPGYRNKDLDEEYMLFSLDRTENAGYILRVFLSKGNYSNEITEENHYFVKTMDYPHFLQSSTLMHNHSLLQLLDNNGPASYHTNAVQKLLSSLNLLHLNPQALREPSSTKAPRSLAHDGSNLPTTLARMQQEDKHVIGDISREMTRLVPGILKIKVERDRLTDRYAIEAQMMDKRTFSSRVLSDGTLRLLALFTLKYDPQVQGVLCLEEPENGVDPLHLPDMVQLLRSMATDFSDPEQADLPLRQVLVTTHSPALVSMPEARDSLLFTLKVTYIDPGRNTFQITRMVPVSTNDVELEAEGGQERDIAVESYAINQVLKYLNNRYLDEAQDRLMEKRKRLRKR